MEAGTRWHRQCSTVVLLALVCLVCWLLGGCGSAPSVDQPLTTGSSTVVAPGTPSATGNAGVIPISVVNAQTNLTGYPGGSLQLGITTSPYAICSLVVTYGQGTPSKASGILPHTADSAGTVRWSWQIDTTAHTGTWPLTVTATLPNGAKTSTDVNVTITFVPINVVTARTNLTALPKQDMLLTIQTGPSVSCTIVLNFGATIPPRTIIHRVGQDGLATFTWKIEGPTPAGVYVLPVTVALADGEQSSISVNMTVLKR